MQFLTPRRTRRNAPSVRLTPGRNTVNEHRDYHDTLRTLSEASSTGSTSRRSKTSPGIRPSSPPPRTTQDGHSPRSTPCPTPTGTARSHPRNNGGLPGFGSHL